jgi:hypothetical protein
MWKTAAFSNAANSRDMVTERISVQAKLWRPQPRQDARSAGHG